MARHKRSLRARIAANRKRTLVLPVVEDLESRLVLSSVVLDGQGLPPNHPAGGMSVVLSPSQSLYPELASRAAPGSAAQKLLAMAGYTQPAGAPPAGPTINPAFGSATAVPAYIDDAVDSGGQVEPLESAGPVGYTPIQMETAYGSNQIFFGSVKGDGSGQTIALIDAGDNSAFVSTSSPSFASSALGVFDRTFVLPDPPSFQKYGENGNPVTTGLDRGFSIEIALDVEWAHAMAPGANLDLVEASSASITDLMETAKTAATTLGASVVSMRFGTILDSAGPSPLEQELDAEDLGPALAANPGVTFLAATGDLGADFGVEYPSVSPLVVGVGGTTLTINSSNQWAGETAWSHGSDPGDFIAASGGGISNTFAEPSWQEAVQSTGFRTVPDVSSDADFDTGVAVYDPPVFGASTPWSEVGGTSLASPTWARLIAIADQGHQILTGASLNGPDQTLPGLYSLINYTSHYHDITVGKNGFPAGVGYDLASGIGSPMAPGLIPALAAYGVPTQVAVTVQPPESVVEHGVFGTIVQVEDQAGALDPTFSGTAALSMASGPAGASFTPVTAPFHDGVAVFDGLSISTLTAGTDYTLKISATLPGAGLQSTTTDSVNVATATNGVAVSYPLPLESSLRGDIMADETSATAKDIVELVYPTAYPVSSGAIVIKNMSKSPAKSISILGDFSDFQGALGPVAGSPVGTVTAFQNRIFEIEGASGNLTVLMQGFNLTGGVATDAGGLALANNPSIGGALLIDGGAVALSNMTLTDNIASGAGGAAGGNGARGTQSGKTAGVDGGSGRNGSDAAGGAIFLYSGRLTLTNDELVGNLAQGGAGGKGGTGANGSTFTNSGARVAGLTAGNGGNGGNGGSASGGGIYVEGGTLTLSGDTFQGNQADGGAAGGGGFGGNANAGSTGGRGAGPRAGGNGGHGGNGGNGGNGGRGANGGNAFGGGLYVNSGLLSIENSTLALNSAAGGNGRPGAGGGFGGSATFFSARAGFGGFGGRSDGGFGASAARGFTGAAGSRGQSGRTGLPGAAGQNGAASGAGVFVSGGAVTLFNATIALNQGTAGGGVQTQELVTAAGAYQYNAVVPPAMAAQQTAPAATNVGNAAFIVAIPVGVRMQLTQRPAVSPDNGNDSDSGSVGNPVALMGAMDTFAGPKPVLAFYRRATVLRQ
jgi:hypothetical protein